MGSPRVKENCCGYVINRKHTNDHFAVFLGFFSVEMMHLALDKFLLSVVFHVVDLRLEGCIRLVVFGTLFCIVSGLPTRETCVATLIVFPDRIGQIFLTWLLVLLVFCCHVGLNSN